MWIKVLTILSWMLIVVDSNPQGFFAPQYAILDPATGRTVKQRLTRQQIQKYRHISKLQREGRNLRPQREISTHYLSPTGDILDGESQRVRNRHQKGQRGQSKQYQLPLSPHKSSPTYFNEEGNEESGLLSNAVHQDPEGYSPSSAKTFLQNTNVPNIFSSLESNSFSDFGSGFFPHSSFKEEIGTKRVERDHSSSSRYQVPSLSRYESQNDENRFNGDQPAYKWRQKYPYYGRKKRSAQSSTLNSVAPFSQAQIRRQTYWVLLDPSTGRTRNDPFKPQFSPGFEDEAIASTPNQRLTRFQPSESIEDFSGNTHNQVSLIAPSGGLVFFTMVYTGPTSMPQGMESSPQESGGLYHRKSYPILSRGCPIRDSGHLSTRRWPPEKVREALKERLALAKAEYLACLEKYEFAFERVPEEDVEVIEEHYECFSKVWAEVRERAYDALAIPLVIPHTYQRQAGLQF
eukprot:maker-scaffold376_size191502-snap-gene-0.29 protein:Tk10502 transcript:maker-scaffold376_size191502-snap-gene-0.29-mRNA-1 annotation:"dynein heavy chain axonemal"